MWISLHTLLAVAMMLDGSELLCDRIIEQPNFKHAEHLIVLSLVKRYSNDFIKRLSGTPGPGRYYFPPHCQASQPWSRDIVWFDSETGPEILIKILNKSLIYDVTAQRYWSFSKNLASLISSLRQ